jgi:predicted metalloprotease with PDZ domain
MIHYELSWGEPHDRLYEIAISFVAGADLPLLKLPAWRPGRYLIQNYAANVRDWSPNLEKIAKSTWRVQAAAGEQVTVRYRYYAGVLDAGSSFLDAREAYFNGSNLFMMVEGQRGQPCDLSIATAWHIETQLPRRATGALAGERESGQTFAARDYDHLIDSPVIASDDLKSESFVESGAAVHLIFAGAEGIDTARFVEPLRAIVREQAALFGGLPLSEYRFLFHLTDRWHGVEHEDSCSITCRRASLLGARPGDKGFDHFLSISAHELFHLWNVKRIMPAVFLPYDYSVETPTRLLWAMEGITSYYGELTLVRSGLWDEKRYLAHLASEMETLESSRGREVISLSQASFDAWLQEPSQMHDKSNSWISFYNKGEVVSALLDLALRSKGSSLDQLMRDLWHDYGLTGRGLEEDAIETMAGPDMASFFSRYIDGTDILPYEELLGLAGLTVVSRRHGPSLGARLRMSDNRLYVDSVNRGGSAMSGGILPGDEILAVGGMRVESDAEIRRLLDALGAEHVEILTARAGRVETRTIKLVDDESVSISLRIDDSTTDEQRAFRRGWLGSVAQEDGFEDRV